VRKAFRRASGLSFCVASTNARSASIASFDSIRWSLMELHKGSHCIAAGRRAQKIGSIITPLRSGASGTHQGRGSCRCALRSLPASRELSRTRNESGVLPPGKCAPQFCSAVQSYNLELCADSLQPETDAEHFWGNRPKTPFTSCSPPGSVPVWNNC
jgi:hypothetical protein